MVPAPTRPPGSGSPHSPRPSSAAAPHRAARRWAAWRAALWVVVALGASASAAEATSTPTAWASTVLLGQRSEALAARTDLDSTSGCACQDDRARTRKLGGAASAAMALAGLILAVRRYRQRNRIPREDRKFGSYRGPKP